jgi:hypothetical protein
LTYKDTTANQTFPMNSLLCHTHSLQGHVEVFTSAQAFTWPVCSAREITLLTRRDSNRKQKRHRRTQMSNYVEDRLYEENYV